MADLVVTVPKDIWLDWLDEGDLAGEKPGGAFDAYDFTCAPAWTPRPPIKPGERVYIVAHGRVRGYAPLVEVLKVEGRWSLVRQGAAVAVTIPEPVRGFRGWRARWWDRAVEVPFPDWRTAGVVEECCTCIRRREIVAFKGRYGLPLCGACCQRWIEAKRAAGQPLSDRALEIEARIKAAVEREERAAGKVADAV